MQPRDVLIQRAIQRLEAAVIALPENTRKSQSEVQLAPNPPQTTPAKVVGPAATPPSQQNHKSRLFGLIPRRQQRIGAA